jgi:hypothetical protein
MKPPFVIPVAGMIGGLRGRLPFGRRGPRAQHLRRRAIGH